MTNCFMRKMGGSRNLRFDESGMKFLNDLQAWPPSRKLGCLPLLNQTSDGPGGTRTRKHKQKLFALLLREGLMRI
jgi:hypothetical protein